jgi:hypothetical protein
MDPIIVINNGAVFEGDISYFEKVFFVFPDEYTFEDKVEQIEEFCSDNDFTLQFHWKN